jgi:hypothetical protein
MRILSGATAVGRLQQAAVEQGANDESLRKRGNGALGRTNLPLFSFFLI